MIETFRSPPAQYLGEPCLWCEEPVAAGEPGALMLAVGADLSMRWRPVHRECLLREVLGSVGHQRRRCSCYGGTEEDPPGLSKREAARAAVEEWRNPQRSRP